MNLSTLPAENLFAHTEKLLFILDVLGRIRKKRGRGLRILDVGCGNGWAVTRHLGLAGDEVRGIDLHEPCIEYANNHLANEILSFHAQSADSLQAEGYRWDVIVLADVLEHLETPESVLSTCQSLLADDGRVLVSVPNGFGAFEIESAISRLPLIGSVLLKITDLLVAVMNKYIFKGQWNKAIEALPEDLPYNDESPHIHFKSHGGWIRLFKKAGFHKRNCRNLSFICGPFSNYLFGASHRLVSMNVWLARRMPAFIVSNWIFELSADSGISSNKSHASQDKM